MGKFLLTSTKGQFELNDDKITFAYSLADKEQTEILADNVFKLAFNLVEEDYTDERMAVLQNLLAFFKTVEQNNDILTAQFFSGAQGKYINIFQNKAATFASMSVELIETGVNTIVSIMLY